MFQGLVSPPSNGAPGLTGPSRIFPATAALRPCPWWLGVWIQRSFAQMFSWRKMMSCVLGVGRIWKTSGEKFKRILTIGLVNDLYIYTYILINWINYDLTGYTMINLDIGHSWSSFLSPVGSRGLTGLLGRSLSSQKFVPIDLKLFPVVIYPLGLKVRY